MTSALSDATGGGGTVRKRGAAASAPGRPLDATAPRDYLTPRRQRLARHVRAHGYQSMITGMTATGVLAGFVSASGKTWQLITYIGIATALAVLFLVAVGLRARPRFGLPLPPLPSRPAWLPGPGSGAGPGRPEQLGTVTVPPGPGTRRPPSSSSPSNRRPATVAHHRLHDPVYGAGMRALLPPSRPLLLISSNRRDVGREHELPLPLFGEPGRRSHVDVDPREFGIELAPYSFERELPEGGMDVEHTLAVKDLVFVPELAAALAGSEPVDGPVLLPEHCADPALLAERDVVVLGGPDTNFWHGALFEAVARQFEVPRSAVPLALSLREQVNGSVVYGSRSISVRLADLGSVFRHTREERADLDERLYPTYGMVIATRNPYAAARGLSHWCVFVAGTRSLGTSGATLGLVRMLRAMRADAGVNFSSLVPVSPGVAARVSAVLFRVGEVEQSMLRRAGRLTPRERHLLPPDGLDKQYSDSYVPTGVDYLAYTGPDATTPAWTSLPA